MNPDTIKHYDQFPTVVRAYLTVVQPTEDLEKLMRTGSTQGVRILGWDKGWIKDPEIKILETYSPRADYRNVAIRGSLTAGDPLLSIKTGTFITDRSDDGNHDLFMVLGEVGRSYPTTGAQEDYLLCVVRRTDTGNYNMGDLVGINYHILKHRIYSLPLMGRGKIIIHP